MRPPSCAWIRSLTIVFTLAAGCSDPPSDGASMDLSVGDLAGADLTAPPAEDGGLPAQVGGWLDVKALLVPSDGTRSLGKETRTDNPTRDKGSKIVYFDAQMGDNDTAEPYWWDGNRIIDASGSPTNGNGEAYGTDPLEPNLAAIKPFREMVGTRGNAEGDPRLRAYNGEFDCLAGGFPDWFLFRRGQVHSTFDGQFAGGRSAAEPMVVASYGPLAEPRAQMVPSGGNPFGVCACGENPVWYSVVYFGLDIAARWNALGNNEEDTSTHLGEAPWAYVEDCRFTRGPKGLRLEYLPRRTTMRRSVVGFSWDDASHNQGYFNAGADLQVTFDEVIFYKNGYKTDPRVRVDPRRDIFSRNVYQGGGARMGHTYRNIISADGASGGPQMRFGGLCENSLIIEGYWFSGTNSNSTVNPWPTIQQGQSALVRNNVQLVYAYPTPADPDSAGDSDDRAQPGDGYSLLASSFGAVVEGNIVSGAMLLDELKAPSSTRGGLILSPSPDTYPDNAEHNQRDNVLRNNIVYRTGGLQLGGNWTGAEGVVVENNVFASSNLVSGSPGSLSSAAQLVVRDNRFYGPGSLPSAAWIGSGNTVAAAGGAAAAEGWPDPNRTLKRYVTEVLGLTLLDWDDEPNLDAGERAARIAAGEAYDPAGIKTFMAVATNMRRGGAQAIPSSGKPSWSGDYPWDDRFTGKAVVNWIRAGFGLAAVP